MIVVGNIIVSVLICAAPSVALGCVPTYHQLTRSSCCGVAGCGRIKIVVDTTTILIYPIYIPNYCSNEKFICQETNNLLPSPAEISNGRIPPQISLNHRSHTWLLFGACHGRCRRLFGLEDDEIIISNQRGDGLVCMELDFNSSSELHKREGDQPRRHHLYSVPWLAGQVCI